MYKTLSRNIQRNDGRLCRLSSHYDRELAAQLRRERHLDLVRRFGKNYDKRRRVSRKQMVKHLGIKGTRRKPVTYTVKAA